MPPVLVSVERLADWLGEQFPEPLRQSGGLLEGLLMDLEAMLLADCGRQTRPFQAAQTGRVELRDGTGSATLWLDYPVAALTSLTLGEDHGAPVEAVTVDDPTILLVQVGSRRLVRRDGGRFGGKGQPGVVRVVYDAQADQPRLAALAILEVAAQFYRRRGSEETTSYREGGFSAELAPAKATSPAWQTAVSALREV